MAITIIEGRPGQGKSLYATNLIYKFLRKRNVYSNIRISTDNPNYHYIEDLSEIVKLHHGVVVLDEVQVYFNSRSWDKLDISFQLFVQQHRKHGLDIYGFCQSVKRADVVLRELIQFFYKIRKIAIVGYKNTHFGFFYLREYDPDSIESGTRKYEAISWAFKFFFADPVLFRLYDTTQEYMPREKNWRLEHKIAECLECGEVKCVHSFA